MKYHFIQFFRGNKYLGSGYIKDKSTSIDRRNVAYQKGIRYYDKVVFNRRALFDFSKNSKQLHDFYKG